MGAARVRVTGRGPDVVVFHGTPTPAAHMQGLAEHLARRHRVLQVTVPGYDGTSPSSSYAWDCIHPLLEEALARESVHRPALVGFSGGALHALALAARGAMAARAVVALAGYGNLAPGERQELRDLATALRAGVDLAEILPGRMLAAPDRARAADLDDVRRWLDAVPASVLADELDAAAAMPNLLEPWATLDIPLLARVGALDLAVPASRSVTLVAAARRGRLQIVPGVGHALLLEDALGTFEAVAEFVQ